MISARDDDLGCAPLDSSSPRDVLHVIPGKLSLSSNSSQQQQLTDVSSTDSHYSAEILDCIGCNYADAIISKIINKRFVELNILRHLHLDIDGPASNIRLARSRFCALLAVIEAVTSAGISFENITSSDKILFAELHSECDRYTIVQLMHNLSIGWRNSSVYVFPLEADRYSVEWHFENVSVVDRIAFKRGSAMIGDAPFDYARYLQVFTSKLDYEDGQKILYQSDTWIKDVMDIFYVFFNTNETSNDVLCGKCKKRQNMRYDTPCYVN